MSSWLIRTVWLVVFAGPSLLQAQDFSFTQKEGPVTILYGKAAPALDSIAAGLLAEDIARVTDRKPGVVTDVAEARGNVIVIGNIASPLVQKFRGTQSLKKELAGKWECFALKVIDKPLKGISKALVITGSDTRGTAYGVFTVSEKIGVSPWYWWADVPAKKQPGLTLQQPEFVSSPPSVKFRGIFINDEDWGLRPWAAGHFEPEVKNIGPGTYAKVFELLLRLKANLLWPAMHPGTAPFYSVPGNKEVAANYSILIGSSHAEPMLRNNVGEWNEKTMGAFNYLTNKEKILQYWEERVKETSHNEAVYTIGMRGVHDGQMEGIKSAREAVPVLERIFRDQRELLRKYKGKDIASVPQAFTAYKEVLEFYEHGLKVPDDVTLVWPDDNYGYIQQLNDEKEKKRSGGSGVYYHVSYWGRPHDYLWLNTAHPSLVREELMKAFENGASRLWVLNAGDIKPMEYNIQLFMDMAYNAKPFGKSQYTYSHLLHWCEDVFGKQDAPAITKLWWEYFNLAFERKPEFMGWSRTEPTTPTRSTAYNHFYYGDEAQQRLDRYSQLERAVSDLRSHTDTAHAAAFYQLVYYPVTGAARMNKKILYHEKADLYARQNRLSSHDFAVMSKESYDSIETETKYYNDTLSNGKWQGMMSMKPRDLPVFQPLAPLTAHPQKGGGWCIAPEGTDTSAMTGFQLPEFTEGLQQRYFVDVFLSDSIGLQWMATPSQGWIRVSTTNGRLSPQRLQNQSRLWVTVDWTKAPKGDSAAAHIDFDGANKHYSLPVRIRRLAAPVKWTGYVEADGYVSMYAQHYTNRHNSSLSIWETIDGLGHTGTSLMARVRTSQSLSDTTLIRKKAACVAYDVYTRTEAAATMTAFTLPTLPLNKHFSMRYAVCVDEGPLQIIDSRSNSTARTEEWKQNVLGNQAERNIPLPVLTKGKHTLKIFAIDPGVILDRIIIDLGGFRKAYSIVPETKMVTGSKN